MLTFNFSAPEKRDVQAFVNNVQASPDQDSQRLLTNFALGNRAAWQRFLLGAYYHPITWWIGIFQLQMQTGMWGRRRQMQAGLRANHLSQLLAGLRHEAGNVLAGDGSPILVGIARFNAEHRKADIAGRMLGGSFTNYASTAGRYGEQRLSRPLKAVRWATNFGIATYGAGIKAVAEGYRNADAVVQAMLTGRPERVPKAFMAMDAPLDHETRRVLVTLQSLLAETDQFVDVSARPVSTAVFCARPENAALHGLCQ